MNDELGYSPEWVGWYIDPPSGWMYGFPRLFNPEHGQSLKEWLEQTNYPKRDIDLAIKYSRFIQMENKNAMNAWRSWKKLFTSIWTGGSSCRTKNPR